MAWRRAGTRTPSSMAGDAPVFVLVVIGLCFLVSASFVPSKENVITLSLSKHSFLKLSILGMYHGKILTTHENQSLAWWLELTVFERPPVL